MGSVPQDVKAFFSKSDDSGVSLHSHLAEIIHKLLLEKPDNPLEAFESISLEVKKNHFIAKEAGLKDLSAVEPPSQWLTQTKQLFKVDVSEADAGIPNVLEEMKFFSWAGVGLSDETSYQLFLAMTKLKGDASLGLKSVRFFGKIMGTLKPYYVVEGVLEAPTPGPAYIPELGGATPEPAGTGLNSCVYFVSNDVCESFTQLPDITPPQVLAALKIKKFFTGNLTSAVSCFPPFPGDESVYLRAQIARIACATVLVPSGKLQVDEESEVEPKPIIAVPAEDYTPVEPNDMASGDNWVHLYGGMLQIGRLTNPPKPEPGEDEEPVEEELEEAVAPLGAISGDKAVVVNEEGEDVVPAWTFKLCFTQGGQYTLAVAASQIWPGAYSVAHQKAKKCASVYFGNGVPYTGTTFTPQAPPPVMVEAADPEEAPDVSLGAENELLKSIDEAKIIASNTEPEEAE